MARVYTQTYTDIWSPGSDFVNLSDNAQKQYLMLTSQKDISAAGTLSLNVKRWAKRSNDGTVEKVIAGLNELQRRRFIVYDTDSEELLVRTFVKWDQGYLNRKRMPAIEAAARMVESPALRRVLAEEFARLGIPHDYLIDAPVGDRFREGPHGLPVTRSDTDPSVPLDGTGIVSEPPPTLFHDVGEPQVDTVSPPPPPSDRVVVTEALVVEPQSSNHEPHTVPPSAGADERRPDPPPDETLEQRVNRLTPIYTDAVKLTKFVAVRQIVKTAINAGYTDEQITYGLAQLARERRSVTADALRYAIEGMPPPQWLTNRPSNSAVAERDRKPVRRSPAAERYEQGMALAAELDAQYAAQQATQGGIR